ncbi:uncharacterized protein LOC108665008 [Hyalella azteca]|uniref:Uncharacterized protein LOC108665008 n=1 Tax=Hyalella azteca TaxID=294128 RepID=A0A8B7N142_HYAAZ|nr:uncharacterized protein LOC108665008 [Hyalella azteca]
MTVFGAAQAAMYARVPNDNATSINDCFSGCSAPRTTFFANLVLCSLFCQKIGCDLFSYENGECRSATAAMPTNVTAVFKPRVSRGSREVARGKRVSATPQYWLFYAEYLVDGNNSTFYHSTNVPNAWIMVDLGACFPVSKVRLLPNAESHYYRFVDTQVLLGDASPLTPGNFSNFDVVGTIKGPVPWVPNWIEFVLPQPRCTRYVTIYKDVPTTGEGALMEVRELEVWTNE